MMNRTLPSHSQKRIECAPQSDDYLLIQRAARLMGLSLAAFATTTLISRAREVVASLGHDNQRQYQYALVLRALNFTEGRGTLEDVCRHTGLDREIIQSCLVELEMLDRVTEIPQGVRKASLWKVVKK